MDIKRIETLTESELLSEGQVARLRAREAVEPRDYKLWRVTETPAAESLRRALALFGPNGERWIQGPVRKRDAFGRTCGLCSFGALLESGILSDSRSRSFVEEHLYKAAEEMGHCGYVNLNEDAKSFSEVRAMFERAIELAATP